MSRTPLGRASENLIETGVSKNCTLPPFEILVLEKLWRPRSITHALVPDASPPLLNCLLSDSPRQGPHYDVNNKQAFTSRG